MSALMRGLTTVLVVGSAALAQDSPRDDVVQKRDGGILVGKILKVEADFIEMLVQGEREPRKIYTREIMPYNVYEIRLRRIDRKSAPARIDLGEFCMSQGLYATAAREFEEAMKLDPSLSDSCRKRKEDARNDDARSKLEEAKKLYAEKRYRDANEILHILLERFEDTPFFKEAKDLVAKITEDVQKENEEKKQQIDDKKKATEDAKAKVKEDQEKTLLNQAADFMEQAQRAWLEGLDHEAKNLTKADRAWKATEAALLEARRRVEVALKSNDVENLKKAKEMEKGIDHALVRACYRLGRLWATELNYADALAWLNKAMKIPHDEAMDRLINEVLLTITQLQMRKRAAGAGF
jgi:tetratricopeptide (TPR) repeat protein